MISRFFRLVDDVYVPHRWHLATPRDKRGDAMDCWRFTNGRPLRPIQGELKVPVEHKGKPLDYSEAGLGVPVVHVKVATVFAELAPRDVQLIPVTLEEQPDQYLILVAKRLIRCIDEKASKVQFWTPEDGAPHKVGTYYAVDDLHIDRAKVGSARVFRPTGWEVALIISGDIKDALERMGTTGAKFSEV